MKNWFITGISSGLGKALAESVFERGDFVIGTYRNRSQVEAFNTKYSGKAHGLLLDATNEDGIGQHKIRFGNPQGICRKGGLRLEKRAYQRKKLLGIKNEISTSRHAATP